ncbi:ATP-binding protein [Streptomyces sp. NBC_01498]|uniref:ATP-binding protein n=1 Tax=Streptomyces sp. NBC_01498 TaxID=2975870 RepID=UPI002E7AFD4F|nr:ATP-binding protein [Streptomyces sp. NBC_01498]WTL24978.1 ATP-binding protein [Streptomyces sp. NBC_01498]
MKHSAAKTLGVAALGAAFAATAAGNASAATPAVPDAGAALGGVTKTLPTESLTANLPDGTSEGVTAAQSALGSGVGTVSHTAPTALSAVTAANPLTGLLGGLPIGALGK